MASSAVVAPRGSPFLTELGNLTPAWHHYLANIEKLTKGLVQTDIGGSLAVIAQRVDALEEQVAAAEEVFRKKNWAFAYTEEAQIINSGMTLVVDHGLNSTNLLAKGFNTDFAGGNAVSQSFVVINENTIQINLIAGTYGGNGKPKAWVLALYELD